MLNFKQYDVSGLQAFQFVSLKKNGIEEIYPYEYFYKYVSVIRIW